METLYNIRYFFETVLSEAFRSSHWNKELIDTAFLWSGYCKQVYEEAIVHPRADKLDVLIRNIGISIKKDSQFPICLVFLKDSHEVLFKLLLQNCRLNQEAYQYILDTGHKLGLNVIEILQETTRLKFLLVDVMNTLKPLAEPKSSSLVQEIEAECVIQYVEEMLSCHNTEDAAQSKEKWLMDFLSSSLQDQDRMVTFLHLLVIDLSEVPQGAIFQKYFLSFLLQRVTKESELFNCSLACKLWNQPVHLLSKIASTHFVFFQCYLQVLICSTRFMRLQCQKKTVSWIWVLESSPIGPNFTFDEVVNHFKGLCHLEGKISRVTKYVIRSFVSNPRSSAIWKMLKDNIRK